MMRKYSSDIPHLYVRGKTFIFRLVIPTHLRPLAGKSEFKISLKTTDRSIALKKYGEVEPYYQSLIDRLRSGEALTNSSDLTYEELVKMAEINGRTYKQLDQLFDNPTEFMNTHSDWTKAGKPTGREFQGYFSTTSDNIKLSALVAFYEEDQLHVLSSLSDRDRDKKINPLKNAVRQLTRFMEQDVELKSLSRVQARDFHKMLKVKIANQEIKANTASKYITHLRVLIKTYELAQDNESETVFDGLNFEVEDNARPPFSIDFLNEHWFQKDVFKNLNPCAKALLFAVIDTGCSFSELCGLNPEQDIKLTAAVPHIILKKYSSRKLKSDYRKRTIPLVGYSLQAFQSFPKGFTRYATGNGASSASDLVNKYMRNNALLETDDHSVYSLRHTFKDRMRKHRVPEELQHSLMGHKDHGMGSHYGHGYPLEERAVYLQHMCSDWKYFTRDAS